MDGREESRRGKEREREGRKGEKQMNGWIEKKVWRCLEMLQIALVSNMKLHLGRVQAVGRNKGVSKRAGPSQEQRPSTGERGGGQEGNVRTRTDRAWSSVGTVCADRKMDGQMWFT